MNALDITFWTNRFNLSKVGEHFINPCCFGEDLAAWLRDKLCERGVEVREPYQEDWGWELPVGGGDDAGIRDIHAEDDEGKRTIHLGSADS